MDLIKYKNLVASRFVKISDYSTERYFQRRKLIDELYSEDYLNKIINDTYELASAILSEKLNNCKYEIHSVSSDIYETIDLKLENGTASDIIYNLNDGKKISSELLKYIFGKQLNITIDISDVVCNDALLNVYYLNIDNILNKRNDYEYIKSRK